MRDPGMPASMPVAGGVRRALYKTIRVAIQLASRGLAIAAPLPRTCADAACRTRPQGGELSHMSGCGIKVCIKEALKPLLGSAGRR